MFIMIIGLPNRLPKIWNFTQEWNRLFLFCIVWKLFLITGLKQIVPIVYCMKVVSDNRSEANSSYFVLYERCLWLQAWNRFEKSESRQMIRSMRLIMTPVLALRIQRRTMQISWTDTLMNSSTSTGFLVMLVRRLLTSRSTNFRFYQLPVQFDLLPVLSTSGSIRPSSGFVHFRFNVHFRYHSDFIYQRIYKNTMALLNPTTNRFALTFTEAIAIKFFTIRRYLHRCKCELMWANLS